jgi:CheY-like chemotaxis protein
MNLLPAGWGRCCRVCYRLVQAGVVSGVRRDPTFDVADQDSAVILVVDDDPDIALVIRMTLESEGMTVVTAPNGRDALLRLREGRPDVVLLDINMPVMDGVTFARCARDEFGDLPIIVMTAGAEASAYRERLGASDSLPKPFDLAELLDKVERFVVP